MKKQILSIALGLIMITIGTNTFAAEKNHTANSFTGESIVNSSVDGRATTSAYDKKGKLVYTITRYSADNFAKNIVQIVKNNYDNYLISGMEKVEQPGNESVFVVYIKNQDSFKTLRVVNNEVELVQDFQKS